MVTKAALMGDLEAFKRIDAADSPADCKRLGRSVCNFDDHLWQVHLKEIAFEVVRQKFTCDRHCTDLLLSTGSAHIVEAAPNDRIWGIGLAKTDPRVKDPKQWQGRNILGSALMQVREHLRVGNTTLERSAADLRAMRPESPKESEKQSAGTPATLGASLAQEGYVVSESHGPKSHGGNGTNAMRRWGRSGNAGQKGNETFQKSGSDGMCNVLFVAAPPDASSLDLAFDSFAVLDFEATCEDGVKFEPQEVIEFPIVLVSAESGQQLGEFRTYVRPVHHPQLTAFCMQLTGIKQADVDAAPTWSTAITEAQLWLDRQLQQFNLHKCIFVTCGDWDLSTMMGRQCALASEHVPERFRQWINIKNLFKSVTGQKAGGMKQMLDALGLHLEGHHHSGLDDSRNIARILAELLRRGGQVDMSLVSSSTVGKSVILRRK